MISATRTPPPTLETIETRVCFRCGVHWRDTGWKWLQAAPCPDCRCTLRAEGVTYEEYRRPKKKAA